VVPFLVSHRKIELAACTHVLLQFILSAYTLRGRPSRPPLDTLYREPTPLEMLELASSSKFSALCAKYCIVATFLLVLLSSRRAPSASPCTRQRTPSDYKAMGHNESCRSK